MDKPKTAHETKLLRAMEEGLVDKTKKLLSKNLIKLNDDRYFDYYLLLKALNFHKIDLAKLLIKKGFRVHKKSNANHKQTVLHAAVTLKNADFIKLLLANGASLDILTLNEQNKTPLHMAIDEHQLTVVGLFILELDVKSLDDKYFLHYAVENGDMKVVDHLIMQDLSLIKKNEENLTPFCIALKNENVKILDVLLVNYSFEDINPDNHEDVAAVYVGSICGNLQIIKNYTAAGLPINLPLKLSTDSWSFLKNYPGFTLLHLAVKHVNLEVVKFLLRAGSNVFVQNEDGSSPLHIAFENKVKGVWKSLSEFHNNNSIIDMILKANTKSNSNPVNKNGLSHFHIACSRDKPTIVKHFIKFGTSIDQSVKAQCYLYKGFSPLHFAAKFRCKKTMEYLLKNGADVEQRDFQKMTALHIAAQESCLDVVSLLLEYNADIAFVDSHGKTPVHWAFEKKNYGIIDLLLSASNVTNSNPTNREGLSHFHIACSRNNVNVVKSFIEKGVSVDSCIPVQSDKDGDSDVANWSGSFPLHFAVSHNRIKIVELLLHSGANVGVQNSKGITPLHTACQNVHEMFREFIENILCEDENISKSLLPHTDVTSVDAKNFYKFGGSIEEIDWSANRKDHLNILSLLLKYKSDANCLDINGNSPVFYAYTAASKIQKLLKNDLNISETLRARIFKSLSAELWERKRLILHNLLNLGVNLNNCFHHGSILHYIISNYEKDKESLQMMEWFLKKGADPNVKDDKLLTPLHRATIDGRVDFVSTLLNYGADANCVDPKDNSTPLFYAITKCAGKPRFYNVCRIVELLIDKGANPNVRRSDGITALHYLAYEYFHSYSYSNAKSVVSALAKAGADFNSRDPKGLTALHIAYVLMHNAHVTSLLLDHGADINVEDNRGRSVCCYLKEKNAAHPRNCRLPKHLGSVVPLMQEHINKLQAIGLPVGEKALASNFEFFESRKVKDCFCGYTHLHSQDRHVGDYQKDVEVLKNTKFHDNCTLYDLVFKSENTLSRLVENPAFKDIVQSESFECQFHCTFYYNLVLSKYQAGVDRGRLLPMANCVLGELSGLRLPDSCSENICKYFTNTELKESIETLSSLLDSRMENLDDSPSRDRRVNKRQKVE